MTDEAWTGADGARSARPEVRRAESTGASTTGTETTGAQATGSDAAQPMAGWYADPRVPFQLRWWDGAGWTTNVYMPDRVAEPEPEHLVPELAEQPGGKWSWPQ